MSQYSRSIIIEVNSNDRLSSEQQSNDFTVPVPQINVPKGATIELDGCVVEEASAGNDQIIELSNQNVAIDKPYTSSWSSLEIRYYLNHAAQNSICHPAIQNNYCNLIGDTRSVPEWGDAERFPYETCYVIPYKGISVRIDQLSGPSPTTYNTAAATNNVNNENSWGLHGRGVFAYSNPTFISWNSTGGTGGSGDWDNFGSFNIAPNPTPGNYSQNAGGLIGIVGLKTAIKKNIPDSSKFTYMKPGYKGPDTRATTDLTELSIYIDNVEISLENDLLETPDELALLVNNQLQGSRVNIQNLKTVKAHIRQWSLDFDGEDDLYPAGSYQEIANITSKTLINIPANFQNDEESKVYGDGFFCKDPQRWIGGNSFLKSTNYTSSTGDFIEGNDPEDYRASYDPIDWNKIFNTTTNINSASYSRYMPCIQALNMLPDQIWVTPLLFTDALTIMEFSNQSPPEFPTPSVGFFNATNPDGTAVNTTNEYNAFYFENGVTGPPVVFNYRMCRYGNKKGRHIINFYPAQSDGNKVTQIPGSEPDFYMYFDNEILGQDKLNLIRYSNEEGYEIFLATAGGGPAISLTVRQNSMGSGLPYIALAGSTGGSYFGNDDLGNQAQVDEFIAIPQGFLISTNVKTRGAAASASLQRVSDFFRRNEKYAGSKTDFKEQQEDAENWYIDLDIGLADDFNNAYSNWMSSKTENIPAAGDFTDFTIYDEQQNFSIIPPYYQNIWSEKQYIGNNPITAGNVGFNFRNPLTIYPISRYADMGCNYRSNENYIRVHSRWFPDLQNYVKINNYDIDYTWNWGTYGTKPLISHPSIQFTFNDFTDKNGQQYNIPFAISKMPNTNQSTMAFINFRDTFKGTGLDSVTYELDKLETQNNWRQCFRVLHCCPVGFDPASTTNPFINSVNNNQTTTVNPMLEVRNFFSNRKAGQSNNQPQELEDPVYSENICYSGRIEDFTNFIYIGAVAPTLTFNKSRMEFSSLFTPRQFNSIDADGNQDPNIGLKICYFNDPCYQFPILNNTIGSVTDVGPINSDGTAGTVPPNAINLPADYQQVRNTGFSDSLSGIGIENIYVRGEGITNSLPGQEGVLKCTIDNNDITNNYFGSLFNLFGFTFRQFKPYYGLPYQRYSESNYNNISDRKYEGISFFPVNSFINQSNMQNINIYGPNYLSLNPASAIPRPPGVGGQPAFGLGYVGFQPTTIQVQTDVLRSENLPAKLQNAFYMIYSNLPNCRYITNNGELNIAGYFYRQYKSGNFYFTYPTSYRKTITQDFQLSTIRIAILNSNGKLAENIGQRVSAFFKITIPTVLPTLDQETAEEYLQASEDPEINQQPMSEISNLTPIQLASLPSLGNNLATANPTYILPESFDPEDDPGEGPIILEPAEGGLPIIFPEPIFRGSGAEGMQAQPFVLGEGPETKQQEQFEIQYEREPILVGDLGPVIEAVPVRRDEEPSAESSAEPIKGLVKKGVMRIKPRKGGLERAKAATAKRRSEKESSAEPIKGLVKKGAMKIKPRKGGLERAKAATAKRREKKAAKEKKLKEFRTGKKKVILPIKGKPGAEKVVEFEGGRPISRTVRQAQRGIRERAKLGIPVPRRTRSAPPGRMRMTISDLPQTIAPPQIQRSKSEERRRPER